MSSVASSSGRRGRGRHNGDGTIEYKSKNLDAERRRRHKLNDGLIALRGLVPKITNMNKATIIEDAIAYIMDLQQQEKGLNCWLLEMEKTSAEEEENDKLRNDTKQEIEKCNSTTVEVEVKVVHIEKNKLLIKIICGKKRGGFTRLMEIMSALGFETTETNFTSFNGAAMTMLCVEGSHIDMGKIEALKEFLQDIVIYQGFNKDQSTTSQHP